ncbi:hypothetical protein [Tetragenococcus koreensis]|uniref:hypothetical protein n=1 Tax=Tetragenococcus koreensis TaxID=290335 RepID=UPI001F38C252|nr:hypothetical protein [Tetragenococcus koreensis]
MTISKIENADMNPSFTLVSRLLNSMQTTIEFKTNNNKGIFYKLFFSVGKSLPTLFLRQKKPSSFSRLAF